MSAPSLAAIVPQIGDLENLVQSNALERAFHDPLYASLQYRDVARREEWMANTGEEQVVTRRSKPSPKVEPLTAGTDPTPTNPRFEQFRIRAGQWADTTDTSMPANRAALASVFMEDAENLGLTAGQSLNRVARNCLFKSYVSGHTVADGVGAASTSLRVGALNGFNQVFVGSALVPISNVNPLEISIAGATASPTVNAIAATPDDPNDPDGPGVLTLDASRSWADGAAVVASNAPIVIRPGGKTSIDALVDSDILTMSLLQKAVSKLRTNRVPVCADGFFQSHVDPIGTYQLQQDNQYQRLNEGLIDGMRYQNFAIGRVGRMMVFENDESPSDETTGDTGSGNQQVRSTGSGEAIYSPDIGAEVVNASGVRILRTIIVGGAALLEKYIPEEDYMSEAGIQGKIGNFDVTNNGLRINLDGVRYIIRAPQDRLQQVVSQSYSWSGGWTTPTDVLGGRTSGVYKRAIVIEHAAGA